MKLNKTELIKILDIEPPFLMIDEAVEVLPMQSAHAIKAISATEWFMQCHLKAAPVMPGTLQTEAMLQTFVLQIYLAKCRPESHCFVRSYDTTLFRKISCEDSGILHAETFVTSCRRGLVKGTASLTFNGNFIASANITMVLPEELPVPID
jgi:3-hydroxyacyl-[acyl-carrier-protein] dehydratase